MQSIEKVALFVEEGTELLQQLEQGLLRLHGASQRGEVHEMFRAAHTIKSNARLIGATECARLAQRVEAILSDMREGVIRPDDTVVGILLQSVDTLRQMTHAIASGQANPALEEGSTLSRALTGLTHRERVTHSG